MNFEQARFNMVEQQIRTWDVLDQRVLSLILATPRELFVPAAYQRLAYADTEIPLADGQTMLAPKLAARILQALQVERDEVVLEVGTGSGYLTALLAEQARHVVSVEISRNLHEGAVEVLSKVGAANVTMVCGDGIGGWFEEGPYNAIVMTGSLGDESMAPVSQLEPGGRLFAVVGQAPAMQALVFTRQPDGSLTRESLFETVVPPLEGAQVEEAFVL